MTDKFAAQVQTLLYIAGARMAARREAGQTTAEYVGIVAFVAVVAIALLTGGGQWVVTEAKGIVQEGFKQIKTAAGWGEG